MTTIKSFTDLNQSRKLAEILPIESADQTWARVVLCGASFNIPEEMQYKHGDIPFQNYNGIGTPCWSLVALLNVIPYNISFNKEIYCFKLVKCSDHWICCHGSFGSTSTGLFKADNPVDACFEMILKLHEQKLL